MRRMLGCCAAALALAALLVQPLAAQEHKIDTKPDTKPPAMAQVSVRAEILRAPDQARDHLLALAEATPADKFTWHPNDKVRTVGEVYAHVAGGNFFIPTIWGAKMPDGVDPRSFDKDAGDKAKTIATLK